MNSLNLFKFQTVLSARHLIIFLESGGYIAYHYLHCVEHSFKYKVQLKRDNMSMSWSERPEALLSYIYSTLNVSLSSWNNRSDGTLQTNISTRVLDNIHTSLMANVYGQHNLTYTGRAMKRYHFRF